MPLMIKFQAKLASLAAAEAAKVAQVTTKMHIGLKRRVQIRIWSTKKR